MLDSQDVKSFIGIKISKEFLDNKFSQFIKKEKPLWPLFMATATSRRQFTFYH